MASVRSRFICTVWMPLCFLSAMNTEICSEFSQTETIRDHQIHQGMSTNISCDYRKNRSQYLTASLRTKQKLCEYFYANRSWIKQFCHENITLISIPETEEISFHLIHLQINNSGVYTCSVEEHIPPPTKCLGKTRICIHVKVPPSLTLQLVNITNVSCVELLCSLQGLRPQQVNFTWTRATQLLHHHESRNMNSTLMLCKPDWTDGETFTCHARYSHNYTLYSKNIALPCNSGSVVRYIVVGILLGLLIGTTLSIEVYYQYLTACRHQAPASELVSTSHI